MVVSGTHSLDMSFWLMEGKYPRSVFAQSVDKKLQVMELKILHLVFLLWTMILSLA